MQFDAQGVVTVANCASCLVGRSGLDINDPDSKYKLKTLPGTYSGLHLLAIMYSAFHQIDPKMEVGADFSTEFAAAMDMLKK